MLKRKVKFFVDIWIILVIPMKKVGKQKNKTFALKFEYIEHRTVKPVKYYVLVFNSNI